MGLLAPRVMNSDVAKPVAQVFSTTNMPGARSKNSHSHFSVSDLSKYDLVKVECQSLELSQISRPLTGRDERSVRGKVTRKEQTHKPGPGFIRLAGPPWKTDCTGLIRG